MSLIPITKRMASPRAGWLGPSGSLEPEGFLGAYLDCLDDEENTECEGGDGLGEVSGHGQHRDGSLGEVGEALSRRGTFADEVATPAGGAGTKANEHGHRFDC